MLNVKSLNRKLLVTGLVASAVMLSACNQKTEETADTAIDDTAAVTDTAVNNVDNAATSVGEAAVAGIDSAGNAIADGANATIDGAANLATDGANVVSQGTTDMVDGANDMVNKADAELPADQQY